jgi:hypothetical protein
MGCILAAGSKEQASWLWLINVAILMDYRRPSEPAEAWSRRLFCRAARFARFLERMGPTQLRHGEGDYIKAWSANGLMEPGLLVNENQTSRESLSATATLASH